MNTLLSTCAPNIETISATATIRESASEKTNDGTSNQLINLGANAELKEFMNANIDITTGIWYESEIIERRNGHVAINMTIAIARRLKQSLIQM